LKKLKELKELKKRTNPFNLRPTKLSLTDEAFFNHHNEVKVVAKVACAFRLFKFKLNIVFTNNIE